MNVISSLESVTALGRDLFFLVTDLGHLKTRVACLDLKLEEDVTTTFSVIYLTIILIVTKVIASV